MNFYNENDSYVAQWLANLTAAGSLLPKGIVDARSILEIEPSELQSFTQCHFFAGIGGWSYALALAGWPDDREVWTGSCPCQPLSSAGQRKGHADKRHLWPAFYRLIAECRPATIFGEQVASNDGREWLAGVRADLEAIGYAVGAADLCAASAGAPHIRQRLFWVADARRESREHHRLNVAGAPRGDQGERHQRERLWPDIGDGGATGGMADARCRFQQESGEPNSLLDGKQGSARSTGAIGRRSSTGSGGPMAAESGVGDTEFTRLEGRAFDEMGRTEGSSTRRGGGFWTESEWLPCLDGKSRSIEPSTFPLAYGIPNRVGRLRAYGNAIIPQVAAEFVMAFME